MAQQCCAKVLGKGQGRDWVRCPCDRAARAASLAALGGETREPKPGPRGHKIPAWEGAVVRDDGRERARHRRRRRRAAEEIGGGRTFVGGDPKLADPVRKWREVPVRRGTIDEERGELVLEAAGQDGKAGHLEDADKPVEKSGHAEHDQLERAVVVKKR